MKSQIIIDFGTYLGLSAEELFLIDPKYCKWIIRNSGFKRNSPELVSFLNKKFEENPDVLDSMILDFGPYYGKEIKDIIFDKNYCKWLLNKSESFKSEYPNMYNELFDLMNLHYKDSYLYMYVLCFKDTDFIKIGKTKQFIVRRMYNYVYGDINYINYNIDWSKSFVYKTNCLTAENELINLLHQYKLNDFKERFDLEALNHLQSEIQKINIDGNYYFNKKKLIDFIPFKDSNEWKENFYVKINGFKDFERMYLNILDELDLKHRFNPDFIVNDN